MNLRKPLFALGLLSVLGIAGPLYGAEDSPAYLCGTEDCRESFDVDLNLGWQLDRFTASEVALAAAVNPEDSGDNEQSALLDIRFNYLLGDFGATRKQTLWLYGGTDRTIRGTEVICDKNPSFLGCPPPASGGTTPSTSDPTGSAFVILRDAQSLEARVGLRYEFLELGDRQAAPGALYVSIEQGFASVEHTDDLAEINQVALGAVATRGKYMNSFIEYGRGKNELFTQEPDSRSRVRVHVERNFSNWVGSVFLETEVDFDSATGSDSVRTKIGINFSLSELAGWIGAN